MFSLILKRVLGELIEQYSVRFKLLNEVLQLKVSELLTFEIVPVELIEQQDLLSFKQGVFGTNIESSAFISTLYSYKYTATSNINISLRLFKIDNFVFEHTAWAEDELTPEGVYEQFKGWIYS